MYYLLHFLFSGTRLIIWLVFYVLGVIADWKLFEKADEPAWTSLVPFYNRYQLYKIACGNGMLFLLGLIPFVSIAMNIFVSIKLARAFGYADTFAIGLILVPGIFRLIMGFDNSEYYGPQWVEGTLGDIVADLFSGQRY